MHFQKYSDNEKTGKVGVLEEETNLSDVPDIPDIETVVVVDNAHSSVLLVVGHGAGVGVLGVVGVGGHVGDGQPLGHVHAQVVRPRQRGHELKNIC